MDFMVLNPPPTPLTKRTHCIVAYLIDHTDIVLKIAECQIFVITHL